MRTLPIATFAIFALFAITTTSACQLTLRTEVERSSHAAAIAIRDDVSDFEKWGTKTFSLEFLRPAYEHTWYFVEDREKNPNGEHDAFVRALHLATEKYGDVDIFLLAHSNRYIDWVRELDPAQRRKIRLVYNTGCGNGAQGEEWMELGVRAYVGHPGNDLGPIFYYYFLPAWSRGTKLERAVAHANASAKDDILDGVASLVIRAGGGDPQSYWVATEAEIFGDRTVSIAPSDHREPGSTSQSEERQGSEFPHAERPRGSVDRPET